MSTLLFLGLLAAACAMAFAALGLWQIERRAWKLALLDRIATRVHAAPIAAPGPERWADISRINDEYRRVTVTGRYLSNSDTAVRGISVLGAGYWLLSPLRSTGGFTVLINRGFIVDATPPVAASTQTVSLTGLLRLTEPKGRFLRDNDPGAERWYSRDVKAIARARHLDAVAPYFVDLDTPADPQVSPITGLTVTQFPNNHLQYAVTWFALSLMVIAAGVHVGRFEWQLRQHGGQNP